MIVTSDLNHAVQIEVLDALFEKCNVAISNVSIRECPDNFTIFFEVTETHGKLNRTTTFFAVVYASNGSIIRHGGNRIYPDNYLGFDVATITFYETKLSQVSKIRIFPTHDG